MVRSMWLNCFYINRQILLKEGEVDTAVMAVLNETGMLGEVVVLAMLENQETAFAQKITFEYHVGKFGDFLQHIGRVCKDEVELLATLCHILEDIATDGQCCCFLQLVEKLFDEAMVACVEFHTDNPAAASANEFERNASGAGEKVEGSGAVAEVDIGLQDIEKVLLRKVCCGTCREGTWHFEMSATIFACDDTHGTCLSSSFPEGRCNTILY